MPGLLDEDRLWQRQAAVICRYKPFVTARMTGHDSSSALASAALSKASSEQFALAGLSMGGGVALEIMRQAPGRQSPLPAQHSLPNPGAVRSRICPATGGTA